MLSSPNSNKLSSIAESSIIFSVNEIDSESEPEKPQRIQVRFFPPDLLPPSVLNPVPKSALQPIIQQPQIQQQQIQQQQIQQQQIQQRQFQQQFNKSSTIRQSIQTTRFAWKMNFR